MGYTFYFLTRRPRRQLAVHATHGGVHVVAVDVGAWKQHMAVTQCVNCLLCALIRVAPQSACRRFDARFLKEASEYVGLNRRHNGDAIFMCVLSIKRTG